MDGKGVGGKNQTLKSGSEGWAVVTMQEEGREEEGMVQKKGGVMQVISVAKHGVKQGGKRVGRHR